MNKYLGIGLIPLVVSCGGQERNWKLELDLEVSQRKDCRVSDQFCTIVETGHPLGCAVSVSILEVEAIQNVVDRLKNEYIELNGVPADETCPVYKATCEDLECGLQEISVENEGNA
jgi:hypothetical protein